MFREGGLCLVHAGIQHEKGEAGGKAVSQWHSISISCACPATGLCCGDPAELAAVPLLPQVAIKQPP